MYITRGKTKVIVIINNYQYYSKYTTKYVINKKEYSRWIGTTKKLLTNPIAHPVSGNENVLESIVVTLNQWNIHGSDM